MTSTGKKDNNQTEKNRTVIKRKEKLLSSSQPWVLSLFLAPFLPHCWKLCEFFVAARLRTSDFCHFHLQRLSSWTPGLVRSNSLWLNRAAPGSWVSSARDVFRRCFLSRRSLHKHKVIVWSVVSPSPLRPSNNRRGQTERSLRRNRLCLKPSLR